MTMRFDVIGWNTLVTTDVKRGRVFDPSSPPLPRGATACLPASCSSRSGVLSGTYTEGPPRCGALNALQPV